MEFYVYVWRDGAGVPFYVGKGKGARAFQINNRSETFKTIHAQDCCSVEMVDYFIHESQAHAFEVELIERYGRRDIGTGSLVNRTDGGEGKSGAIVGDVTRAKIGAASANRSSDTLDKMSAYQSNRTPEHRAKLSLSMKGRTVGTETRAKIGAATKRRSPEATKRSAASRLGVPLTEDHRAKIRASMLGLGQSWSAKTSLAQRHRSPSDGGLKGVSRNANGGWRARVKISKKAKHLGTFSTPEDAALAYDVAAYAAWGLDCYLNFPDKTGGKLAA